MPAIYWPTLERVQSDFNYATAISLTTYGWTSINKNFLYDYVLLFLSKYEHVFRLIGLFRRTRVVDAMHNFLIQGEFVTEQLFYLFTNVEAEYGQKMSAISQMRYVTCRTDYVLMCIVLMFALKTVRKRMFESTHFVRQRDFCLNGVLL